MTRSGTARSFALGALALGLAGCGGAAPLDRASTLVKAESAVGSVLATFYVPGNSLYEDEAVATYVRGVAERVAAGAGLSGRTWEFQVLDDPQPAAYSLLGGHVYVTRGMLAILDSEAELAGVLAHEMGHVAARHGLNTMSDLQSGGRAQDPEEAARSRDKENQADQLAVRYLAASGYEPRAFVSMLRALLAFRPGERDRSGDAARIAHAALVAGELSEGETARERYLGVLDGLVLDEDPRDARLDGGRFILEKDGFSIPVPTGMLAAVVEHQMIAVDAGGQTGFVVKRASRGMADNMVSALKKDSAFATHVYAGMSAVTAKLETEWTAVLTIGEGDRARWMIFSAAGPDEAAGRAALFGLLEGIRPIEPGERRLPRRLRTVAAGLNGPLVYVLGGACGGPAKVDVPFSLELHGAAVARRAFTLEERVKCAPPAVPEP